MRSLVYLGLVLGMATQPSVADRAAYGGVREIVAQGNTITVRHHHDWSRIPIKDDGWALRYSPATPFGVAEETSNLEIYSSQGELIVRTPSPPLTYLKISADDKYVIGLSDIKHLNDTHLVVFNPSGKLLLRRRISAHLYCLVAAEYQALKQKHREAFSQVDASS